MENKYTEEEQYTSEELQELYRIIFLRCDDDLILFDMNAFADCGTLKKWLSKEKLKTIAPVLKRTKQVNSIEEVLFCDISKVPLLLNGSFHAVAKWRLEHGK
jgi:hypothetical protein